jgi:hypothetical protein
MGRLATGRGNALSQAQQLTALGVKPKKPFSKVKVGSEQIEVLASDDSEPVVAPPTRVIAE